MQRQSLQKLTVEEFETKIKEGLKIFSELDLSRFSLRYFKTHPIELKSCNLSWSIFSNSKMDGVNFALSNLSNSNFVRSDLKNTNFILCKLFETDFTGADLQEANLTYISSDTNPPIFSGASLIGADLGYSEFKKAFFNNAILSNASLIGSNFSLAFLESADLTNANLRDANLDYAKLSSAIFTNANLYQCDLSGATIVGAKFDGVIRASFSSDLTNIGLASKRFLSFLNRPDLSIDQKKQILEIEDANPDKPKISEFLIEKTADILKDKFTDLEEKKSFQEFLKKVQELEEELAPKIEKQSLIKQEPGEPLIVVKSESQEPRSVVNKRQREEGPPAIANVGMGSVQDIPQSYGDDEILDAAQILSSMRHNVRA